MPFFFGGGGVRGEGKEEGSYFKANHTALHTLFPQLQICSSKYWRQHTYISKKADEKRLSLLQQSHSTMLTECIMSEQKKMNTAQLNCESSKPVLNGIISVGCTETSRQVVGRVPKFHRLVSRPGGLLLYSVSWTPAVLGQLVIETSFCLTWCKKSRSLKSQTDWNIRVIICLSTCMSACVMC